MRDSRKSKRVSWASDFDICQVRLFLSEESPSQVGLSAQDDLQAKTSLLLHPGSGGSDGNLPPGFEGSHPSSQLQMKLSQIPLIRWTNPPKILLNLTWLVVAGEESQEVEDQNKREMRELEAIYPRISSIPPNPSVSMDVEDSQYLDSQTALIPITPMEDEDAAAADVLSDSKGSQSLSLPASSLSLTNILHGDERGNLIGDELLSKILSSPEFIEKIVRNYGIVNNPQGVNQAEANAPSTGGQVALAPSQLPATPYAASSSPAEAPPAKDFNYYKSLIQEHGGERRETLPHSGGGSHYTQQPPLAKQDTAHNFRPREQRPKIMKPCMYFNSSRGCRNGANCAYQHDAAFQPRGSNSVSKRMKMDSEISS